jgi:threonine/homoserine/homoserine lactone efflux protein
VPELSNLLAFIGATVALLLIPGPAVIYMLNRTLSDGRRVGLAAVAGLEVGDTIQATLAAVGLSAVLATSTEAFNAIKWMGVAYLAWTGIRTLLTKPGSLVADESHVPVAAAFRQGILVNALNPKTGLFFLSIFPQFVDSHAPDAKVQSLVLAVVFVVLASIFNTSYVLMASKLRDWLLRGRAVYVMRRHVSGVLFIALSVLAMTSAGPATAK